MTVLGRAGAGVGSGVAPLKVPCRGPIPDNDIVMTLLLFLFFSIDLKERCCLIAKCCCHPGDKIVYISVTAK